MKVNVDKFLQNTSVERAAILHNTKINEPYMGHSQIILINNRNEGILYSFEYDIKSIFSYNLYKNHRKSYDKLFYPISLGEQIRVLFKTPAKVRKIYLDEKQLQNILNKQTLTLPINTPEEDKVWTNKQINYINIQINNNPYNPFIYYFSSENGKKMLEKAESLDAAKKPYIALENNCIHNVIKVLNAGGIDIKSTSFPFIASFHQRYFAWKEAHSYEDMSHKNNVENHLSHKLYRVINFFKNKSHCKSSQNSFTAVVIDNRQLEFDKHGYTPGL